MRWLSAIGGAIVTAAGVVVIASAVSTPSPSGVAPSLAAPLAPPPPPIVRATTTTTTLAADQPVVSGLDPAVSDALTTLGYTDFVGESDLRAQLPDSVVDALIEQGAVLVVPDTAGTP